MNAWERRMEILQCLCIRRHDTVDRLAREFGVSNSTLRNDIQVLSYKYPLYTTRGRAGGVHVVDGYHLGIKYLTDEQAEVLERLPKQLNNEEMKIIREILKTFKNPQMD